MGLSRLRDCNKELNNDWSKFKVETKEGFLSRCKNGYIEFCNMLNETDFELVSDYVGDKENVILKYRFDDSIKLNMRPNSFRNYTYKAILNFKEDLIKNKDEFVRFVGLTKRHTLVSKIKTFDNGIVNIDIVQYSQWNRGRQDFYEKLKEVNGYTDGFYINNEEKMNIYIDNVKLNPVDANNFKNTTYKRIINFKEKVKNSNDKFITFIGLTSGNSLLAQIKTFDGGIVNIDIANYSQWIKGRQSTYDYCEEKGYKILSLYKNADKDKILIDFNCGHEPHWILSTHIKQKHGCPICKESKGERNIRLYLENNNIDFIQEYRFEGCRYKYSLPFDFYIPSKNLCIEFDGIQHFEANHFFGSKGVFEETQIRDSIKSNYCKDKNINLLRIPYWELDNIEKILDKEFGKLREEFKKNY